MHLPTEAYLLTTIVALFAIMGVLTLPPVFLAVTSGMNSAQRRKIAFQASLAVVFTMVASYFVGSWILALFKIDIDAFRIAGALVVANMAWGMITGRVSSVLDPNDKSPAVIPLAIPKTAGPGAVALAISMGSDPHHSEILGDVLAIVVVTLIALFVMLAAGPIERVLGDGGLDILNRVFGLILLAIAMTSIMVSLLDFFPGWAR